MKSRLGIALLAAATMAFPAMAANFHSMAISNCQSAAARRIRRDGYRNVRFQSSNVFAMPNGVRVSGRAFASGWYRGRTFSYGCSVRGNGVVSNVSAAMH